MLVRFAIELSAIHNCTNRAHINRLLKVWELGVLVHPPSDKPSKLKEKIDELSESPKKLWQTAWEKVRKSRSIYRWDPWDSSHNCIDWENIDNGNALQEHAELFDVAILEEDHAEILNISIGESKVFNGIIEGVRLSDVDQSKKFKRSASLSMEPIRINKLIEALWTERFESLAQNSNNVVIVDQWAVSDSSRRGLLNLLKRLDQDSNGCCVTIYSAIKPLESQKRKKEIASLKKNLELYISKLNCNNIKSIKIRLFDQVDFNTYAHNRHIRFDSNVVSIDRGVSVFYPDKVKLYTEVSSRIISGKEEKEKKLDKKAEKFCEFCLPLAR